jgi:shikimate dehydrogenase
MKFGLLGKDIGYSQSPKLFQLFKNHTGIDLTYTLYDVEKHEIKPFIQALKVGELDGLQVTKPYKEAVMAYCDVFTDTAKKIGSVNTIYVREDLVIGDNTDAYGFEHLLLNQNIELKNKHVCIFGNGGASKAVFYVCQKQAVTPTIIKRSNSVKAPISPLEMYYDDSNIKQCEVIIQATSHDFTETAILDFKKRGCQPKIVIDLMYHKKTNVMTLGKEAYDGKLMLIYQAIQSFELFLNQKLEDAQSLIETMKGAL